MGADFDQGEVLREAPVAFPPCLEHELGVFFGPDLRQDPVVSVVYEYKHRRETVTGAEAVPRGGCNSCPGAAKYTLRSVCTYVSLSGSPARPLLLQTSVPVFVRLHRPAPARHDRVAQARDPRSGGPEDP